MKSLKTKTSTVQLNMIVLLIRLLSVVLTADPFPTKLVNFDGVECMEDVDGASAQGPMLILPHKVTVVVRRHKGRNFIYNQTKLN